MTVSASNITVKNIGYRLVSGNTRLVFESTGSRCDEEELVFWYLHNSHDSQKLFWGYGIRKGQTRGCFMDWVHCTYNQPMD